MNRILVIDDDPYIRELVSKVLGSEGFEILEASNGREAFLQLGDQAIELVVCDVMMPQMDGFEFAAGARRYYPDLPILMLTAKGATADKVKGLGLGADDYLVKPFENTELLARVKALLRRYGVVQATHVSFGKVVMDAASHTVTAEGMSIELPLKEFELLFTLGSCKGKTLTRRQLIDAVWGYDYAGNERTLDVHINRLRDQFPAASYDFRIVTLRGLGYRLEDV